MRHRQLYLMVGEWYPWSILLLSQNRLHELFEQSNQTRQVSYHQSKLVDTQLKTDQAW